MKKSANHYIAEYSKAHLPGISPIGIVKVVDRTKRWSDQAKFLSYNPVAEVDGKLADYLESQLIESARIERIANFPDMLANGFPGRDVAWRYRSMSPRTIYVAVTTEQRFIVDGSQVTHEVPGLVIAGSSEDLGLGFVCLNTVAPGDEPCSGFCTNGDEAFSHIKGRIDAVIHRVLRKE